MRYSTQVPIGTKNVKKKKYVKSINLELGAIIICFWYTDEMYKTKQLKMYIIAFIKNSQ